MEDQRPQSDSKQPLPFSPLVEQAIELSAQWHDRTYRKSRWRDEPFEVPDDEYLKVPVVSHVTSVAMIVQRAGWDDETVAAAFLHDVIEDENRWEARFRYENLSDLMGASVAELVREVSEEKLDASGRNRPWRDRKIGYIERLRNASDGAVAISVADKLHNLWTINKSLKNGVDVFSRGRMRKALQGDPDQQRWFFNEIHSIAEQRDDPRLNAMRSRLKEEMTRFDVLTGK
ncbi:MAG: HD domain-containing protein [Rhodothermales bacterium]|nr:HD domain-containing protein [Rhodothermales bacterium]